MNMNLQRRQELYLDGIEVSLVMAKVCYSRLFQNIEQYSRLAPQGETAQELQNQILLDSWSFIDTVNRLRILVSQTPGLKKNSQVLLFQKSTQNIEILRDFVQHMDGEIHNIESTGFPVWGSLSWVYVTPEMYANKKLNVMLIIPGRLAKSKGHPVVNPAGKPIEMPIDHISLTASNMTINLSDVYRCVVRFQTQFATAVEQARGEQEKTNEESKIIKIYLNEHS